MRKFSLKSLWMLAGLMLATAVPVTAIPGEINISGYLADGAEAPISGNFAWRVVFYANETTTTQLGAVTGTSEVVAGIFDLPVQPPEALLVLPQAWYTLAIDTNGNGVDAADLFADRFKLASVPFALATKPSTYFAPYTLNSSALTAFSSSSTPHLSLTKFITPAGGVEFNQLIYSVQRAPFGEAPAEIKYAIGIYDKNGELKCQTGIQTELIGVTSKPISGRLQGSETYYIGSAVNTSVVGTPQINRPPGLKTGLIKNVISGDPILPLHFDPAQITYDTPAVGIGVTFQKE